jgi:hypothetical protein
MTQHAYPARVPCPTRGQYALIQAAPITYGKVLSSKPNYLYWCPKGHSFTVYGSSL